MEHTRGAHGTAGGYARPHRWERLLGLWLLAACAGLAPAYGCLHVPSHRPSARALSGDFDQLYIQRLLKLARESSLGAIVILAHELVYEADGRVMEGKGSFYVPNDYVLKLAREHPEFLPAVSIHPARPDALDELDRCLEAGAVMMKCLPNCQNIDCNDRRYLKFWERMAEARLPLLAHTGGEHTVPVIRKEFSDPRF